MIDRESIDRMVNAVITRNLDSAYFGRPGTREPLGSSLFHVLGQNAPSDPVVALVVARLREKLGDVWRVFPGWRDYAAGTITPPAIRPMA